MKISAIVAAAGLLAVAGAANAQFSGPYAPANWTLNPNAGNGTASNDGTTLVLTGTDGANTGGQNTDYTIAAIASGTWSFDWKYSSTDVGTFDTGGYLLNGVYTQLAANNSQGGGSASIPVLAGDIIGYRVFSADGIFGEGVLSVTNFKAPIPAPASLALLGMGGLVAARRRR
jgi:hypothetical protein